MKLENTIIEMVLNAEAKALATCDSDELNVVPVSTVKIIDDKIILVNYFMGKTLKNIQNNSKVALACWSGLSGCQIKASAEHQTEGKLFDDIKSWVAEILPSRIVKGIIILNPDEVYDISASSERAGNKIS